MPTTTISDVALSGFLAGVLTGRVRCNKYLDAQRAFDDLTDAEQDDIALAVIRARLNQRRAKLAKDTSSAQSREAEVAAEAARAEALKTLKHQLEAMGGIGIKTQPQHGVKDGGMAAELSAALSAPRNGGGKKADGKAPPSR